MRGAFVVALVLAAAAMLQCADAEVHVLGKLMPETGVAADSHLNECTAQQAEISEQQEEIARLQIALEESRRWATKHDGSSELPAEEVGSADFAHFHQRRALLVTPAPTASPSIVTPSSSPSVSPVPTTEEWFELSAKVADLAIPEIVIETDVAYPSQSPITINTDRSVSIVGRSVVDGGRVTLDGLGDSRLFLVKSGGTLHLTNLNLVNGSAMNDPIAPAGVTGASPYGGAIFVGDHASLIMRSCDIRGQGPQVLSAVGGAGVFVDAFEATASFFNTTFANLHADFGAAINSYNTADRDGITLVTCHGCQFVENCAGVTGLGLTGIVFGQNYDSYLYFYDCLWLNNRGASFLVLYSVQPIRPLGRDSWVRISRQRSRRWTCC